MAAAAILVQPAAVRSRDRTGEFNPVRARARLEAILGDQRAHAADTLGDDEVRARLIGQIRSIGLTPSVRDQFACNSVGDGRAVSCARVRNVVVAIGPATGKALLINAHYDSTAAGPGASDDGIGVASLLEVGSILRNERLKRPLILLFNEGEELGLIGARAFLADPLSRRVDSLVNLEARGVRGPVTMFETSVPNGPPVRAFARAVNRPFANSLATSLYRQLPNNTDVTTFAERGWTALNFAMIGNETRYHSPGDDLAALDLRSLQHMGDQTLAVARQLIGSSPGGGGSVLFADIAGRQLVIIPQMVGFALLGLMVAVFGWIGFRRGGMWRGLGIVLGGFVVAAALAWLGVTVMGLIRPGSFWRAYPLWAHLAVYACGLVAAVGGLALLGRRLTVAQLRASYWLGFLLLGLVILFIAPGGVIYFLLPPAIALIGIAAGRGLPGAERVGAIFAAFLLWLTLGEVLALLGELLSNGPIFVLAPLAMLIALPWLIEAKAAMDGSGRLAAIGAAVAVMTIGWIAVGIAPAYSADRQQRFVIQHFTDTGSGRAYWAVLNDHKPLPDAYGAGWHWGEVPNIEGKRWIAPAPRLAGLEPPRLEAVGRSANNKLRTVAFRTRPNGADSVTLIAPEDSQIRSAGTAGFVQAISANSKGKYYLRCSGRSCARAILQFTTASTKPIDVIVVGSRSGLPPGGGRLVSDRPHFARPQYSPNAIVTVSKISL